MSFIDYELNGIRHLHAFKCRLDCERFFFSLPNDAYIHKLVLRDAYHG